MTEKKELGLLKGQVRALDIKVTDGKLIVPVDQISRALMKEKPENKGTEAYMNIEDHGARFQLRQASSGDDNNKKAHMITIFDLIILATVITLLVESYRKRITPAMIYRRFTGKAGKDAVKKVNAAMQRSISEAIIKMGQIQVEYDFSRHEKVNNVLPAKQLKGQTTLMRYIPINIGTNGSTQTAYQYTEMPIIGLYALIIRQFSKVRSNILCIRKYNDIDDTWDKCYIRRRHMVITMVLLRRIMEMRRNKDMSRKITFTNIVYSIIESCDDLRPDEYGNLTDKTERDLVRFIINVLMYWQHCQVIKDLIPLSEDYGYDIVLGNSNGRGESDDIDIDVNSDTQISFW